MKKVNASRLFAWCGIIGIAFLIFMTLMRVVFFYRFHAPETSISQFAQPFLLGLSYDLRIVCAAVLFPFLIGNIHLRRKPDGRLTSSAIIQIVVSILFMGLLLFFIKKGHATMGMLMVFGILFALIFIMIIRMRNGNPFMNRFSERVIKGWFILVSVILVLLYSFDFEHYDYLQQRLSATILNFAGDAKISLNMMWETYPIFQLLLFIIISFLILIFIIQFSFKKLLKSNYFPEGRMRFLPGLIFTLALGFGIFGRMNQYPLRWSDAFSFADDFKANLALNPVQSFLSTMQFRNSGYDIKTVKEYYPLISRYLRVDNPDEANLNFTRHFEPVPGTPRRNVVIVICESFSMYKSSMSGNKLNTTPFFNQLCSEGVFFDRCFTPSFGTARGVWATLTGIPDVEYPNTSSRNPSFVDQHSIINDYEGYSKFYFIGGSSSWANIRGLLVNNLSGLNLLEEQDFNAKKEDVWGISDKQLFLAANDTFAKQEKPFIAVIQTADNHRPYTIPAEDKDELKLVSYPKDTLYKYGFTGNDELNAFRYSDFAFGKFMEAAAREAYFKNTIFVFVGDHGIKGNIETVYPESWAAANLSLHHVPLLFYAPEVLGGKRISRVCSQDDVLPSVSSLAGIAYTNTTMGINLFDNRPKNYPTEDAAFVFDPTLKEIGIITDSFVFKHNLLSNSRQAWGMVDGYPRPNAEREKEMDELATAWYQTAKYLLHNNQKNKVRAADK